MGFSALDGMELNSCSPAEYNAVSVQRSSRDVKEYLSSSANAFSSGQVTGRVLVGAKRAGKEYRLQKEKNFLGSPKLPAFRLCQELEDGLV